MSNSSQKLKISLVFFDGTYKNDDLVSLAMGEEKWSKTEKAVGKPYQWFCEISLKRQSKVFNPPGSEKSYQNWKF